MPSKLRSFWIRFSSGIQYSHPIALFPWSSIRRVGQSRLMAMTIVVPLVGSLLLFNQHLINLLTLSPAIIGKWFDGIGSDEASKMLTFSRLYYLYFGLSFLGMGSAMFAMLCPIDVKNNASVREYLQAEGDLVTRARMGLIIPNIAEQFLSYFGNDDFGESPTRIARLSEPREFTSLYYQVFHEIYLAFQRSQEVPEGDVEENSVLSEDEFADHRGRPDVQKIAQVLYMGTGAHQYIIHEIQNLSAMPAHKNDVLTLQYQALDHSKPWSRVIVTGFYALGFTLLFIPTLISFVKITAQTVGTKL